MTPFAKNLLALAIAAALLLMPASAFAQQSDILRELLPDGSATFSGRIVQGIILLTVLSMAPGLLVTVTCFTRFVIAFSFLRSGLGLQSTPSNLIVISLSLFMTYFVMEPVFQKSWNEGIMPLVENQIEQDVAYERIVTPLKAFMVANVRPTEVALFENFRTGNLEQGDAQDGNQEQPVPQLPQAEAQDTRLAETVELGTLVPAFLLSELRRGFEIGFLILLPFLVIDLVVATVTMSMGMMMLPPTVVALPFKVLFFVLIDGWNLLVGELLKSVNFVL
ncbi:MAG: flagellar type III secretion system pore protein FliP [Nitratireductor sp.]|nr:flagellar type III secretion system pore protein FliP [Nitratireductor sp.]MCC0019919.1 flagellar type III secretion system pore protein FliP [Nitratireductor sp.]